MAKSSIVTETTLDLLQQLLPNIAASGGYELLNSLLTRAAGASVVAVGTFSPVAIGAIAVGVLGYIGLRARTVRNESLNRDDVMRLLRAILEGNQTTRDHLVAELREFGIEVTLSLEELRKRTGEVLEILQSLKADAANSKALLEKHEGLWISLETFILQNFSELREVLGSRLSVIESILKTQPQLEIREIPIDTSKDQMLLFYGYRRTEMFGRDGHKSRLMDFNNSDGRFLWWLMIGSGGVGKSRLALEVCLALKNAQICGFLPRDIQFTDWASWQPLQPTFIVVDYVAHRAKEIGKIVRTLTSRSPKLDHPVRMLLIERSLENYWYDQFTGTGGDAEWVKTTRYAPPSTLPRVDWLSVEGLDDDGIWSIFTQILREKGNSLPERAATIAAFRKIDQQARPLFAAMAADSVARNLDIRQWDGPKLLKAVLGREYDRWNGLMPETSERDKYLNFLAVSTMVGGISAGQFRTLSGLPVGDLLPPSVQSTLYDSMIGIRRNEHFSPLEPDVFGEYFILDRLEPTGKRGHRIMDFVNAAWRLQPIAMASFLDHAVHDFSTHPSAISLSQLPTENDARIRGAWASTTVNSATRLAKFGMSAASKDFTTAVIQLREPHILVKAELRTQFDVSTTGIKS